MYHIDGSTGGGSILRIALPIALAQGRDINILNIRQQRSRPGLRPQHLIGVQLLCEITGSEVTGGHVGSTELRIIAGKDHQKRAEIKLETAGAISLIFQLLSNYCMMSQREISVKFDGGGTHTQWSPNLDYMSHVTIPALEVFGQRGNLTPTRLGYYPKGGAQGEISINCSDPPQVELNGRFPGQVHVLSRATTHLKEARVAERQIEGLTQAGVTPISSDSYYDDSRSVGSAVTAWNVGEDFFWGFSELGKKGVRAELVGEKLAQQIPQSSLAAVDEFLSDQLMVALSQSPSGSSYTIPKMTDHVGTNFNLINYMLDTPLKMSHHDGILRLSKN